jgi:hypothetical protein
MPIPWPVTDDDWKWEAEAEDLQHKSLSNVRAIAEKWAGSIATLLGIVATVLLIQGPEKLEDLKVAEPILVVGLSLAAALAATMGLIAAIYAAQGVPRWTSNLDGYRLKARTRELTQKSVVALNLSRAAIAVALVLLLTGTFYILIAEATDSDDSSADVSAVAVTSSGTYCGTLVLAADGQASLSAGTSQVSLTNATSVAIVDACPAAPEPSTP